MENARYAMRAVHHRYSRVDASNQSNSVDETGSPDMHRGQTLIDAATAYLARSGSLLQQNGFCFLRPPTFFSLPLYSSESPLLLENSVLGKHLQVLLTLETKLTAILSSTTSFVEGARIEELNSSITEQLRLLRSKAREDWESTRLRVSIPSRTRIFPSDKFVETTSPLKTLPSKDAALLLAVAALHLLSGVSEKNITFFMRTSNMVQEIAGGPTFQFPSGINGVIDALGLRPDVKKFACCPNCFFMYPYHDAQDVSAYPEHCNNKNSNDEICGGILRQMINSNGKPCYRPTKAAAMRDVTEWIARLHGRKDLEHYLHVSSHSPGTDSLHDIFDSPGVQSLIGPDGRPFLQLREGESHLVLSFNEDGVNISPNKASARHDKVAAFYMTCLNLPEGIRSLHDNMCLIMVHPREPTRHEANNLFIRIAEMLLDLWHYGVYLTETARYRLGCLVLVAIIPFLADLPAIRLLTGYLSHSHTYFCHLCRITLQDIDNLDFDSWPLRDWDVDRSHAFEWMEAKKKKNEQNRIEREYGIRWSVFMRLPYFRAAHDIATDGSMHGFCLDVFRRQLVEVMGMSTTFLDGEPFSTTDSSNIAADETAQNYLAVVDFERPNTRQRINSFPVPVLRALCRQLNLQWGGVHGRGRMIAALQQHYFPGLPTNVSQTTVPVDPLSLTPFIASEIYATRGQSTIADMKKEVLIRFAELMSVPVNQGATKSDILNTIKTKRIEEGFLDRNGKPFEKTTIKNAAREKAPKPATVIFGPLLLGLIENVRAQLEKPPSMQQGPRNLLSSVSKDRSFSAGEIRTLATIEIPMTILPLWGLKARESPEYKRLTNYMHLISAYRLAESRVVTSDICDRFRKQYQQYLITLLELYPGTSLIPYQHILGHYHIEMARWGPSSGHSLWRYEQKNGILRTIPTNLHHDGEMEYTKLVKYTEAANLRMLIASAPESTKKQLPRFFKAFEKAFQTNLMSKLNSEIDGYYDAYFNLDGKKALQAFKGKRPVVADSRIHTLLEVYLDTNLASHTCGTYPLKKLVTPVGTFTSSGTNGQRRVAIQSKEGLRCGLVSEIFTYIFRKDQDESLLTFVVVRLYRELLPQDIPFNFCSDFPESGFRLVYQDLAEEERLVELGSIVGRIIARPLLGVRTSRPCMLMLCESAVVDTTDARDDSGNGIQGTFN